MSNSPISPSFAAGQLYHNARVLDTFQETEVPRLNKIVCTIGPATQDVEMMMELIEAGMSICRLNFSHGDYSYHQQTIDNAREAIRRCGRDDVAIALDTKGPEIRTGKIAAGTVTITAGSKVVLSTNPAVRDIGDEKRFYVDYLNIGKVLNPGSHIYVDDGVLDLVVDTIETVDGFFEITVTAQNTSQLSTFKGVNLPNTVVDLPPVSEKDAADLAFAVKNNLDMIFASFIQSRASVKAVREALVRADPVIGKRMKIISKVENHAGVIQFDEVLDESDGVMVARGDLGIEIPMEKVFVAQKMMIARCNLVGKPVICATQMLESMCVNPRPTRAEASDVANAVLDGADCVMLSGETAKGKYPIEAVKSMARICREAQRCVNSHSQFETMRQSISPPVPTEETIAVAAVTAAYDVQARALIVLSNSGGVRDVTRRVVWSVCKPVCERMCARA